MMTRSVRPAPENRQAFRAMLRLGWILACLGITISTAMAREPAKLNLTTAEQTFLNSHGSQVELWFNPDFPPLEYEDHDGRFTGMGADIMDRVEAHLGVTFKRRVCKDWTDHLKALEKGFCAIAPTIVQTPERDRFILFTTPYATIPVVIIGTERLGRHLSLSDLDGLRVAAVDGYATVDYLRREAGDRLTLVAVPNVETGLADLAFGKVDAYVENLAVASHYIVHNGISSLHVAGVLDYDFAFRIGVSRRYPELYSAIEKALATIDPDELTAIREKWIALKPASDLSPRVLRLLATVGTFLALLVIGLMGISVVLRRRLTRQMAGLQAAQNEISRQDRRYRELFLQAPVPLIEVSTDGTILRFNEASIRAVGYTIEDIATAEDWFKIAYPDPEYRHDVRNQWERAMAKAVESGGRIEQNEYTIRCKDGSDKVFLIGAAVVEKDSIVVSMVDINERIRMEKELRRNEESLRVTLDSIGDAVIATDTVGRIMRMNPIAVALTGWTVDEAVGRPLSEVFVIVNAHTRETVADPVAKVLATNTIVGLANHTLLIARGGGEHQIADSGAPIRSATGEILGVVLVFRDVTREHAVEEQLRQSQKMQALGQLAGGVAHDFNNMLGAILGSSELLNDAIIPTEETTRYLDLIMRSTQRAADLTAKLLMFSRKQAAEMKPLDVNRLIQDTLALIEHTIDRRIRVTISLDDIPAQILGDGSQLQNALLNLLINATHAMPEGGVISVCSRRVILDEKDCQLAGFTLRPGSHIAIDITDTGCGIAPEHLPRIFEPFFTTKGQGKGTGLGLSAVFGTVEQHGGAIRASSKPDQGTCFHLLFPILHGAGAIPETASSEPPAAGSGRILLADDEDAMRDIASTILGQLGYDVICAKNGREALELFNRHDGAFDLVILDMIMPVMNGRDCFAALKRLRPDVRVILSSGFTPGEDVEAMEQMGLSGFIRKPFRKAELATLIHNVLRL